MKVYCNAVSIRYSQGMINALWSNVVYNYIIRVLLHDVIHSTHPLNSN